MSEVEGTRPQDINKVAWYKKPTLPWGILFAIALVFTGIAGGWVMRGDLNARIDNEVAQKFEQVKK
jgi:hypothetical protein